MTSRAWENPGKLVHLRRADGTSMRLCLALDHTALICTPGWGEPHQHADSGTRIMVHGQGDAPELECVIGIIAGSMQWVHDGNAAKSSQ